MGRMSSIISLSCFNTFSSCAGNSFHTLKSKSAKPGHHEVVILPWTQRANIIYYVLHHFILFYLYVFVLLILRYGSLWLFWQHLIKLWLTLTQTLTILPRYLLLNIILSPIITLGLCNVWLHFHINIKRMGLSIFVLVHHLARVCMYMYTRTCTKGKMSSLLTSLYPYFIFLHFNGCLRVPSYETRTVSVCTLGFHLVNIPHSLQAESHSIHTEILKYNLLLFTALD